MRLHATRYYEGEYSIVRTDTYGDMYDVMLRDMYAGVKLVTLTAVCSDDEKE